MGNLIMIDHITFNFKELLNLLFSVEIEVSEFAMNSTRKLLLLLLYFKFLLFRLGLLL